MEKSVKGDFTVHQVKGEIRFWEVDSSVRDPIIGPVGAVLCKQFLDGVNVSVSNLLNKLVQAGVRVFVSSPHSLTYSRGKK